MTKPMRKELVRGLGFAIIAGSLIALADLFGTASLTLPVAWLYWTTLIALGVWVGSALSTQIEPLLKPLPWIVRWLAYSLALTVPMFGFVTVAQALIGYPVPIENFAGAAVKVWVVTAAISGVRMRERDRRGSVSEVAGHDTALVGDTEPAPAATITSPPAVLKRAKPELRSANLLALSSEDHYVRLHTDKGEDLVLLRLSDAVNETGDLEGIQVHRSWWVAKEGIGAVRKRSEGGTVVLKNGTEAPISRRSMAQVKEAGWI
ncbi:MAG: LytTR family DNA-binding domain-containing protein [Pseudomonadota bacterium]